MAVAHFNDSIVHYNRIVSGTTHRLGLIASVCARLHLIDPAQFSGRFSDLFCRKSMPAHGIVVQANIIDGNVTECAAARRLEHHLKFTVNTVDMQNRFVPAIALVPRDFEQQAPTPLRLHVEL